MSGSPILVVEGGASLTVSADGQSLTLVQHPLGLSMQGGVPTLNLTAAGPQGPEGPQGVAGSASGSVYVHEQTVAAATWVIDHNVGRMVSVTLFDDSGRVVISDIEHGTVNQATVTWSSPTTGSALIV